MLGNRNRCNGSLVTENCESADDTRLRNFLDGGLSIGMSILQKCQHCTGRLRKLSHFVFEAQLRIVKNLRVGLIFYFSGRNIQDKDCIPVELWICHEVCQRFFRGFRDESWIGMAERGDFCLSILRNSQW